MIKDILNEILNIIPEDRVCRDEPMNKHTSFRTGGPADCYIRIGSVEELSALFNLFKSTGQEYVVIGNGSNLLFSDRGYRGAVIEILSGMSSLSVEGEKIMADAGTLLSKVSDAALKNSLKGFEFASGIPSTVGGAMVMNAGAYGGEMKDIVLSVRVIDKEGRSVELSNEEMDFGYRKRIIKEKGYIVTQTVFSLEKGEEAEIESRIRELSRMRREKQPLEYPSAGSTFKRPENNFAGKLIMEAGLSGLKSGGAKVSEKHCGFIINEGGATSGDIYSLIKEVQEKVFQSSGIRLEPEVMMIGEF